MLTHTLIHTHDLGHVIGALEIAASHACLRTGNPLVRGEVFAVNTVCLSWPHQLTESVLSVTEELANAPGGLIGPLQMRERE